MNKSIAGALIAMLVLGVASFALFGALVQTRIGRPVAPPELSPQSLNDGSSAAVLAAGLEESLSVARRALASGQRPLLMRALDAARRVSEVARSSAPAPIAQTFQSVHGLVTEARRSLQNGQPDRVDVRLRTALATLSSAGLRDSRQLVTPQRVQDYRGAILLNSQGVRIGKILGVTGDTLTVGIGGFSNLFGFLDHPRQTIRASPAELLFGRRRTFGSTYVVLPTKATAPGEVIGQLRQAQ